MLNCHKWCDVQVISCLCSVCAVYSNFSDVQASYVSAAWGQNGICFCSLAVNNTAAPNRQALHSTVWRPTPMHCTVQCSARLIGAADLAMAIQRATEGFQHWPSTKITKSECSAREPGAALYCVTPIPWALHNVVQRLCSGRCTAVYWKNKVYSTFISPEQHNTYNECSITAIWTNTNFMPMSS